MRVGGARYFSGDVVRVARECIWYIWQSRLNDKAIDKVLRVIVQQLFELVRVNVVIHAENASGTRRRVKSTTRLAWVVCQGKNIILCLTIEFGAIVILEWDWRVGKLCPTIHASRCGNLAMIKIEWRRTWGQIYCALRIRDVQTWRYKWFTHGWMFDAIVTASLSRIYRQLRGTWLTLCRR